jgi:hypothetical protein
MLDDDESRKQLREEMAFHFMIKCMPLFKILFYAKTGKINLKLAAAAAAGVGWKDYVKSRVRKKKREILHSYTAQSTRSENCLTIGRSARSLHPASKTTKQQQTRATFNSHNRIV